MHMHMHMRMQPTDSADAPGLHMHMHMRRLQMHARCGRRAAGAPGVGAQRARPRPCTVPCITRDTLSRVREVSIRELRNHGGDVVDRAARGEAITITRSGKSVAQLGPVSPDPLAATVLLERWRRLPPIDPVRLRADIDETLDARI
jgi:prevent-host-death family protein